MDKQFDCLDLCIKISKQKLYYILSNIRGQPHGAFTTLLVTLAQPYTRVELEFLSIYHPNPEEAQDAKLFGMNLRQHMANALKVPTSDLTFAEAKEKYAKKLKRIESMKKDKNC